MLARVKDRKWLIAANTSARIVVQLERDYDATIAGVLLRARANWKTRLAHYEVAGLIKSSAVQGQTKGIFPCATNDRLRPVRFLRYEFVGVIGLITDGDGRN